MEIQLNEEFIIRCNNQSMYARGTNIQNTANVLYRDFIDHFENNTYNENQKKIYEDRKNAFKEYLTKAYNEYLRIAVNYVSVNIAGPSNYHYEKMQKVCDKMVNKESDIINNIDKFYNNTEKMLKKSIPLDEMIKKYRNGYNEPISSDDPNAKEKLQAKLEYLEEKHKQFKDYNKKARANGQEQLPPYVLANSNQNIKSVKDRLSLLEKMNNLNKAGYYFSNGEVRFDKEDMRVKIFFDEKPDIDTRQKLKSHAFKWSSTNLCWQRKLTPDSIYITKRMFEDIGNLKITKTYDYRDNKNINL